MRCRVLGSAAGGGFPQWNCRCPQCQDVRLSTNPSALRTQASLAVEGQDGQMVLINAGPDLRQQLLAWPEFNPRTSPRDTPIVAVALTNADIDHVAGLLTLRESQPLVFYASERVRHALVELNVIFGVLAQTPTQSTWLTWPDLSPDVLSLDARPRPIVGVAGPVGLDWQAFPVPGKLPSYLVGCIEPKDSPEDTLAVRISQGARSIVYVPGIQRVDPDFIEIIRASDVLLIDGTCWTDDELAHHNITGKTARRMGHLPISGPGGSLALLKDLTSVRKIYTHINNTNPILNPHSPERRAVLEAGFEVAFDGMEIVL